MTGTEVGLEPGSADDGIAGDHWTGNHEAQDAAAHAVAWGVLAASPVGS